MTTTDLIIIALSIFLFLRGASRGFMRSLINPVCIIITTILSLLYYQYTSDWIISLLIGLVGPFLMGFLLKLLLNSMRDPHNPESKPSFLSCMGGSAMTLIWGWVFIFPVLAFLSLLPASLGKTLENAHNDVIKSRSYHFIVMPLEKSFISMVNAHDPLLANRLTAIVPTTEKSKSPLVLNASSLAEAKSLTQDPRFQKILQDPDIQEAINAHDFVKLMSNPKMVTLTQQIMSDPDMMKKVMDIYSSSQSKQ